MIIKLIFADASGPWLAQAITAGGWPGVAILGLLLLMSFLAVALVVEQLILLRPKKMAPEGLANQVSKRLGDSDGAGALAVVEGESPLAVVLKSGLIETESALAEGGWSVIEEAMQGALYAESSRLLRRIDYLSVIGNLAPMLGLLGTVVGMIFAFREVAETQGAATAGELASGIYQALVTTVGGLLVAIPSLAAYAVLRNRVDDRMAEVAEQATRATLPLKRAMNRR